MQRFLKPNFVVHEQMGCDVRNGDVFIFINGERKQKRQELARPRHYLQLKKISTTTIPHTTTNGSVTRCRYY